jgi:hypothetical protein
LQTSQKNARKKYQFGIPKNTNRAQEWGTNEQQTKHNKRMSMSKIGQRGTSIAHQEGANELQ